MGTMTKKKPLTIRKAITEGFSLLSELRDEISYDLECIDQILHAPGPQEEELEEYKSTFDTVLAKQPDLGKGWEHLGAIVTDYVPPRRRYPSMDQRFADANARIEAALYTLGAIQVGRAHCSAMTADQDDDDFPGLEAALADAIPRLALVLEDMEPAQPPYWYEHYRVLRDSLEM